MIKKNDNKYLKMRGIVYKYLLLHPCFKCGESDPVVLQFHHKDPSSKERNIGQICRSGSIERLYKEIAKCDILCANCHTRETAIQQGWIHLRK